MNREMFCLKFKVNKEGEVFSIKSKDTVAMSCSLSDGILDFWIRYDYKEDEPLHLKGNAKCGDNVTVNILPYRIELHISGVLVDEEWPYGNHYLSDSYVIDGESEVSICDLKITKIQQPDVIGNFQNAEGWRPEPNVNVGDCMPHVFEDRYHVMYLKDRRHHGSKWAKGAHQWCHISTLDFLNWDIHPMAVEIDSPEEFTICTGSWIYENSMHYLYYTVKPYDLSNPAKVRRSISKDGYHFEKDKDFYFALCDKYVAETVARDPKIFKTEDGLYHILLTATQRESQRGCLVHLVSEDMDNWKEIEEPIYIAPEGSGEPECPDYFYKDGFYYLICSLGGKAHYQYSRKPFSDWQIPEDPIIPCKAVPKAAIWNDRLIFTGFEADGGYGGTMTFMEASVQENGELSFYTLKN